MNVKEYAEKVKAVRKLLRNPKWVQRSSRWIAQEAGVSLHFVTKVQTQLNRENGREDGRRYGLDGRPIDRLIGGDGRERQGPTSIPYRDKPMHYICPHCGGEILIEHTRKPKSEEQG